MKRFMVLVSRLRIAAHFAARSHSNPETKGHELNPAEEALGLARVKIRDDRLASDGPLAFYHEEALRERQVNFHPAAEPDDPDPVACHNSIALADSGHNPPCDGSRNENRADMKRVRRPDRKAMAFVIFRRPR